MVEKLIDSFIFKVIVGALLVVNAVSIGMQTDYDLVRLAFSVMNQNSMLFDLHTTQKEIPCYTYDAPLTICRP